MLKGIDIYHNDPITPQNLSAMVKGHQIFFNFIKSSTGINGKDSAFATNWDMSRKAGMLCGAYHWLWPAEDASLQATNFITQYKTVSRSGVLPPVVDIEWTWNAKDSEIQNDKNELWHNLSPSLRVPFIKEYLDKVESELNVKPIIYTAASFWTELIEQNSFAEDNQYFSQYLLWIADPNNKKKLPKPWKDLKPSFIQSHFGENSNSNDLFDKTDQNDFNGELKELLNITIPGFTVMRGFPFSMIVFEFQKVLATGNFLHDEPDGYFGKNTEKAVMAFQEANGLIGNGIVDAQTWGKLLA
jgi:lysozyme